MVTALVCSLSGISACLSYCLVCLHHQLGHRSVIKTLILQELAKRRTVAFLVSASNVSMDQTVSIRAAFWSFGKLDEGVISPLCPLLATCVSYNR